MLLLRLEAVTFFMERPIVAMEWYENLLSIKPARSSEEFVLFQLPQFELALHQSDVKSGNVGAATVPYFKVESLEDAISELVAMGATIYRAPILTQEASLIAQIRDPFGNVFGLIERKSSA